MEFEIDVTYAVSPDAAEAAVIALMDGFNEVHPESDTLASFRDGQVHVTYVVDASDLNAAIEAGRPTFVEGMVAASRIFAAELNPVQILARMYSDATPETHGSLAYA